MYHVMFVGGLVIATFFLMLSIFLFFRKNVPKLIRSLTGKNLMRAGRCIKGTVVINPDKQEAELPKHSETDLPEDSAITLRLCAERKTCLLMEKLETPMPAIFEVLEDITEFYGK